MGYAKGIDSLALDPRDASKVYIMGGGGYNSGPAIFMASSNQGQNFTTVQMPFSTGGNASGRQAGEKLQVDPNNSNILFYGTANAKVNAANNGLWKSTDGGQHWNRVTNFNVLTSDDSGAGIPPDSVPHVFDRFWQATTRERRLGAGLGLPITKGIVEAHGGRIWVESTVGRGTTFFFTRSVFALYGRLSMIFCEYFSPIPGSASNCSLVAVFRSSRSALLAVVAVVPCVCGAPVLRAALTPTIKASAITAIHNFAVRLRVIGLL